MRRTLTCVITAVLCCAASLSLADATGSLSNSKNLDSLTRAALNAIVEGDIEVAEKHAKQLTRDFPDYSLGQLLYADMQRVAGLQNVLLEDLADYSTEYIQLLQEAKIRFSASLPSAELLPSDLIQVGEHIRHVILIDVDKSELFLFDTSEPLPRLIKNHYIASGTGGFGKLTEGDLKTPLGIYAISGFRTDASLPDLYGSGALMLNYPNALDKLHGRTGSGIWLHGVPHNRLSRAPRSSEGCVTMANDYFTELHHTINLESTHVILSHQINWISQTDLTSLQTRFQSLFAQYRNAWLEQNTTKLHSLYTDSALQTVLNRSVSTPSTQRVAARASGSKNVAGYRNLEEIASILPASISILNNPSIELQSTDIRSLLMAFPSGSLQNPDKINLYWSKDDTGRWKIVKEVIESGGI